MKTKIKPKKLSGKVIVPPSKSMSHRYIVSASLADGISKIYNISYSDDIEATIDAMKVLGANIEKTEECLIIKGIYTKKNNNISEEKNKNTEELMCRNIDEKEDFTNLEKKVDNVRSKSEEYKVINCRESGSTLRFILPILTLFDEKFELKTLGNLINRPIDPYLEIFMSEGIAIKKFENSYFIESGKRLKSKSFIIDGNISSQFVTGMMFVLPILEYDSEIIIRGSLESRGYIDMTLDSLRLFGVEIQNHRYEKFVIKGGQKYKSGGYKIEGDYSQAAFFVVAAALGNDILIEGLSYETKQGDKKILEIVENFGVKLEKRENSIRVVKSELKGFSFDGSEIPDIVPIISLLASLSEGSTTISNIARLRIKESDRIFSVYRELKKLGADIEMGDDYLKINGKKSLCGGVNVSSHKDHRIAMMLSIAATVCEGDICIENTDSVKKSYPDFWEKYIELGGVIDVVNMGKKL